MTAPTTPAESFEQMALRIWNWVSQDQPLNAQIIDFARRLVAELSKQEPEVPGGVCVEHCKTTTRGKCRVSRQPVAGTGC